MTTDIIALAKIADAKFRKNAVLSPEYSYVSFSAVGLANFATLLEAKIRKEFEAEIAKSTEQNEAMDKKILALDSCACSYDREDHLCMHHSPQLTALTEQNSNLMGVLELAHYHMQLWIPQYQPTQNVFETVTKALTPQPENREEKA